MAPTAQTKRSARVSAVRIDKIERERSYKAGRASPRLQSLPSRRISQSQPISGSWCSNCSGSTKFLTIRSGRHAVGPRRHPAPPAHHRPGPTRQTTTPPSAAPAGALAPDPGNGPHYGTRRPDHPPQPELRRQRPRPLWKSCADQPISATHPPGKPSTRSSSRTQDHQRSRSHGSWLTAQLPVRRREPG